MKGIAVVTGASSGIGLAAAERFLAAGVPALLVARRPTVLADAARSLQSTGAPVHVFAADVADADQVDALAAAASKLGPVDFLVNAAGVAPSCLLASASKDLIESTIRTNLTGTILVSRAISRLMLKNRNKSAQHGGQTVRSIVNVASVIGTAMSRPGLSVYAASKSGILGFSKSLARELGPKHICVNVVAPGFIHTNMTASISADEQDQIRQSIPIGRFGTAKEVADAIYFMATSSYISGQCLVVDGAMSS